MVKLEWHIRRVTDADLPPHTAAPPDAGDGTPSHKLLAEASLHKVSTMGRAMGPARAHRFTTAAGARGTIDAADGGPARVDAGTRGVSEAFVGAGALKMELPVGTEAGSRACALQGMLLLPGVYEAAFKVVGVRESAAGSRLPVNDYVISHPLRIAVVDDSGVGSGADTVSADEAYSRSRSIGGDTDT